ncbi:MAG TPA: hypothetical protein VKT77_04130 [Chthonomonadaceae bacterium]|nr:hypothetical protein [Chthonomonadaceae bacterium]
MGCIAETDALRIVPHNRIAALFVALIYVFFATLGAVAHTDAPAGDGPAAGKHAHATVSAPRDCAVCEWQAISATPLVSAPPPTPACVLVQMQPAISTWSFTTAAPARVTSRGPPAYFCPFV